MEPIKIRGHNLEHLAEIYLRGMGRIIPVLIEDGYIDNSSHPFVDAVKKSVDDIFDNNRRVSIVVGEADFICSKCPKEWICPKVHPEKSEYHGTAFFDSKMITSEDDLSVMKNKGFEAREYDSGEFRQKLGL